METESDINPLTIPPRVLADIPPTDEYRHVLRAKIAKGVKSLREGRSTDGGEFMARMDSELAELERQEQ